MQNFCISITEHWTSCDASLAYFLCYRGYVLTISAGVFSSKINKSEATFADLINN